MNSSDLVTRLWESDAASALTNEAARHIEAQDKLIEDLKEKISWVDELTQSIITNPAGDLWNYGTKPTAKDEFEWKVRSDLAHEIRTLLSKALSQKDTP